MLRNVRLSCVVVLALGVCSCYASGDAPVLIGPYAVSGSGEFLFCGAKKGDDDRRHVIVPLRKGQPHEPCILSFPGTDKCLGASWRPGAHPDELLFVTTSMPESQAIKRFRVSTTGVEQMSSHAVDPDLLVTLTVNCWSLKGTVFALRIAPFGKHAGPNAHLAFSKDNGKTISLSPVRGPTFMTWVDDSTFYMTYVTSADPTYQVYTTTVSKAELNVDSLAVATHQVLQDNNLLLASGNLHGSVVYSRGGEGKQGIGKSWQAKK